MSPDNLRILLRGILATTQNEHIAPAQRLAIIASAAQGALAVLDAPPARLGLAVEAVQAGHLNRSSLAAQWVVVAFEA